MTTEPSDLDSLSGWLDQSPTPYHVVESARDALIECGFMEHRGLSDRLPQAGFLCRDGMIIAWRRPSEAIARFSVVGAHTDSPNIRVHPSPDIQSGTWQQLGVEIYGGVLLNSWLDRDLGVAGAVITRQGERRLFTSDAPIARIPQLAIHLDRDVNDKGLQLERHTHIRPIWATSPDVSFVSWLAHVSDCRADDISAFDAQLFDMTPASVIGADGSLFASGRLDNQLSCWAAVDALTRTQATTHTCQVVALFDHEEVGSSSQHGASGPALERVLRTLCAENTDSEWYDIVEQSLLISADNAHAIHPNYPERHDSRHAPMVNLGPVVKLNVNQRYATTATTAALVGDLARGAGMRLQHFVSRNNIPCGSTIGPLTATRLGIPTVDVGVAQLSMHSAREVCGAHDPSLLRNLLLAHLSND
jgi:aspartyl aminopeptidase